MSFMEWYYLLKQAQEKSNSHEAPEALNHSVKSHHNAPTSDDEPNVIGGSLESF